MKMTLKARDAWLAALRSGNYQQAQAYLKTQNSSGLCAYCCLGVLEELEGTPQKSTEVGPIRFLDNAHIQRLAEKEELRFCQSVVLTVATGKKYQTENNGPKIPLNALTTGELEQLQTKCGYNDAMLELNYPRGVAVAELNDLGISFPRIADLLEAVIEVVPE